MGNEAAIYCRVSTEAQEREGTSLDTQRAACLKYAHEHDYKVTHQFIETYSGLTLDRPKLDELRQLVRAKQINNIIIYCLDRYSRNPTHGVILLDELEKSNITLKAVTEDIDTSELGKLINYIRQYVANVEAEKLRERSTRGIKARVYDKGLPVTFRPPYGYQWDKETASLMPDNNYPNVKYILDMAIEGRSYDYIIAKLEQRGITSPGGQTNWNKHTIARIIRNPVYAGKYYAFKSQAAVPISKNENHHSKKVKSSVRYLPPDQWHYIPDITIINPPITEQQHTLLLAQLKIRQAQAKRNAKREYLLRGMIVCMTHIGKEGRPRTYHGQPHRNSWRYTCPVGGCESPHIDGPYIEWLAKEYIRRLFAFSDKEFYSLLIDNGNSERTEQEIKSELKKLENEDDKLVNNLAKIEDERISGTLDDIAVYEKLKLKYQGQRHQIAERQDALLLELSQIAHTRHIMEVWQDIRTKCLGRVGFTPKTQIEKLTVGKVDSGNEMPFEEWRGLLNKMRFKIQVVPEKDYHPADCQYFYKNKKGDCIFIKILCELPLNPESIKDIALPSPGNGLHKQQYYPIRLSPVDIIPNLAGVAARGK